MEVEPDAFHSASSTSSHFGLAVAEMRAYWSVDHNSVSDFSSHGGALHA